MSVRDWYYCRDCEVYGHGAECWCCGSTTPQRAQLPRLDDKRLMSERLSAALDRERAGAAGESPTEPMPTIPVRYAS